MIIKTKKQGLNIETDIRDTYRKKVTKFGTSAKINCPKKYLQKDAIILIPKRTIKKKDFNIKADVKALYSKKVTKFGNGAKIDCPKNYIGKEVIVIIH